jgi:hypothetical protein
MEENEYGYIILRTGTGTITTSNSRSGRALMKDHIRTPQDRPLSFLSFREKNRPGLELLLGSAAAAVAVGEGDGVAAAHLPLTATASARHSYLSHCLVQLFHVAPLLFALPLSAPLRTAVPLTAPLRTAVPLSAPLCTAASAGAFAWLKKTFLILTVAGGAFTHRMSVGRTNKAQDDWIGRGWQGEGRREGGGR